MTYTVCSYCNYMYKKKLTNTNKKKYFSLVVSVSIVNSCTITDNKYLITTVCATCFGFRFFVFFQ